MAVENINGASAFDPTKVNEGTRLRNNPTQDSSAQTGTKKTSSDSVEVSELAKFTGLAIKEPTPNEANIQEIQKAVENGAYATDEVIEETAARLADQLL